MSKTFLDSAGLQLYDSLIKGVAGGSLSLSSDGTKIVLKSVDGTILSQVDAPSGGGSGGDVDVSGLIPKMGDRGVLAGYNTLHMVGPSSSALSVTIDENSPDDMFIMATDESMSNGTSLNLTFSAPNGGAYVKNILVMCGDPSLVTANFGAEVYADSFFSSYVNDLGLSMFNQIVVTSYGSITFISNKVIA